MQLWLMGWKDSLNALHRNDNFVGFSGHPPCPAPIRTGIGAQKSGMRRVQFFFLNQNRVQGRIGFSNNMPRPTLNIKLQVYPPLINIFFPSNFLISFQGSCSSLSLQSSFLPHNEKIHMIIHAYRIIKSIGSLINSHYYHFLPPNHIFLHL